MTEETEQPTEVEVKARSMGWVPKEEFKGAEDKWIPADEFVDRGEHLLPILHATNKRIKEEVATLKTQMAEQTEALRVSRETIAALDTYHAEDVKRKVEAARKNLKIELEAASERGDHKAVAEITEEMTNLKTAAEDDKTKRIETERQQVKDPTQHPDFISWRGDNPWYGTDLVRTSVANGVTWKLRQEGNRDIGRAFLDKVTEGVEAELKKISGGRPAPNKAEGGGPTGGNGSTRSNGKGYDSMPAEAKAACDSFEKQLVGEKRLYKTIADWRKKYAADYFSQG